MGSTRTSKTSGEAADAAKGVPSENPAEVSVGEGDAPAVADAPEDPVDAAFADMEAKGEVTPAGMVRVRYKGRASVRDIRPADFASNGIEQDAVVFNQDNRWVAPVTPEAADFLVGQPAGEFVRVTAEEEEMGEEEEAPVQQVPEFNVEPGTGGAALAVAATPDSAG